MRLVTAAFAALLSVSMAAGVMSAQSASAATDISAAKTAKAKKKAPKPKEEYLKAAPSAPPAGKS